MDPWYSQGSGDMLEVASMGLHVAQMTSQAGMRACFDAVTVNAAKIMHLPGYGIAPGNRAEHLEPRRCTFPDDPRRSTGRCASGGYAVRMSLPVWVIRSR